MENVIPIADLPSYIDQVINQVNEGVVLARKRGILAEFPDDGGVIQFDVTVIFKWQDAGLAIVGIDTSQGSDKGSSTSTTIQEDKGTSTTAQDSSSTRDNNEKSQSRRTNQDQGQTTGANNNYTSTNS